MLTAQTLGKFGSGDKLQRLRSAFEVGQDQFVNQRNLVILVVFAVELLTSLFIALVFLRPRPAVIVELKVTYVGREPTSP